MEHEGQTYDLPRKIIPQEAREGDVLRLEIHLDKEATNKRIDRINSLAADLFVEK